MGDWSFECIQGNLEPGHFDITEEGISMGRGEFNTLVLNSGNVSRKHARVFLFEGVPYVQDLGSRNGVLVNGSRIDDQAQLMPDDSVGVGEFTFRVGSATAAAPKKERSKLPLFAGVGVAIIAVIGAIGVMGGGGDASSDASDGQAKQQQNDAAENAALFNFEAPPKEQPKAVDEKAANATGDASVANVKTIDVANTSMAMSGGTGAQISQEQRAQLVREYLERGLEHQEARRLAKALEFYTKSLQLDPGCALCQSRKQRLEADIEKQTRKHYDDALRYYNSLRYDEAVANWEVVLNLQSDTNSEMYRKTVEYVEKARAKLEARQY